jgi:hypothetical protein
MLSKQHFSISSTVQGCGGRDWDRDRDRENHMDRDRYRGRDRDGDCEWLFATMFVFKLEYCDCRGNRS